MIVSILEMIVSMNYRNTSTTHGDIESMKIPLTNSNSTDCKDVIGTIDISEDTAKYMAKCFVNGLGFRLNALIEIREDGPVLKHLSMSAYPASAVLNQPNQKASAGVKENEV